LNSPRPNRPWSQLARIAARHQVQATGGGFNAGFSKLPGRDPPRPGKETARAKSNFWPHPLLSPPWTRRGNLDFPFPPSRVNRVRFQPIRSPVRFKRERPGGLLTRVSLPSVPEHQRWQSTVPCRNRGWLDGGFHPNELRMGLGVDLFPRMKVPRSAGVITWCFPRGRTAPPLSAKGSRNAGAKKRNPEQVAIMRERRVVKPAVSV